MSKYTSIIPTDIESALGWLLDDIRPNTALLDVGCSSGYFGGYIKNQKKCKVYGIEVSEDVKEAKKVLDGVYSFDLEGEWPEDIYERKYDYILFGDVLEHLKDPGYALKRAKRLLNSQGRMFVSIPNIAHISTRLELMQGSFQYEKTGILDNTHLQYFTLNTFTLLAESCGYEVVSIDYSINDFPRKIIMKQLSLSGLKPTQKFWEMSEGIEARAYQYKFTLKGRSANPAKKPAYTQLPPKPEHYRDTFIRDLEAQIVAIKKHADEQQEIIYNQEAEIENLNTGLVGKLTILGKKIVKSRNRPLKKKS
jgi:SAM-dependent methyltransferase